MAAVDLSFAREVTKYAARYTYGIVKTETDQKAMLKMLNKQMMLNVLGDSTCLEALDTEEVAALEGVLILKS